MYIYIYIHEISFLNDFRNIFVFFEICSYVQICTWNRTKTLEVTIYITKHAQNPKLLFHFLHKSICSKNWTSILTSVAEPI